MRFKNRFPISVIGAKQTNKQKQKYFNLKFDNIVNR